MNVRCIPSQFLTTGMATKGTAGTYHTTTVDVAKGAYTTVSHIGRKRSYDDFYGERQNPKAILANVTDKARLPRAPVQAKCFGALKASEIQDLTDHDPSVYSQRHGLALTPTPTSNPLLDLSHPVYGLPSQLAKNLASLGVKSIYPWQSDCLLRSGALSGEKNLIYTAPTGGGKSLVADILMLKKVSSGEKALLVLPYVSLVQEKLRWLRKVVDGITKTAAADSYTQQPPSIWRKQGDEDSIRVVGFFGGSKTKATWADIDIAVCTIEKVMATKWNMSPMSLIPQQANGLVNTAIEDCSIGKLGVVVMDELHMLDDESRGYILELMATKLLSLEHSVQLIGMSATLNNTELLATWLDNAKFYVSRYRPVPVEEHLVFDNTVYSASTSSVFYRTATQLNSQTQCASPVSPEPLRLINASQIKEFSNPVVNSVVSLANETARMGYGALIFCSSRSGCEKDAVLISQVLPRPDEVDADVLDKRIELVNDLRSTSAGLDYTLERTIPVGVAFHHAGLTSEERDLIAAAYDEGAIKVIVATCSLAAGINLPARRVILHGARMGIDFVGPSMLRQMRGRAGRKGKDEIGETYLCCQKGDLEAVAELMEADIPVVESCLFPEKRGIKRYFSCSEMMCFKPPLSPAYVVHRALLEVIATRLATSRDSIDDYTKKTLLYHSIDHGELAAMTRLALDDLLEIDLIKGTDDSVYEATLLGQAIVASALTPEDGLFVHRELSRALRGFVLDGEMHAFYTFTPVHALSSNINWRVFRTEMERLGESNMRVLDFVGLKPMMINKMAHGGTMRETTAQEVETARIYKRFYSALQLRDICNEMPIHAVARKYDLPRGIVQNLAQACHGFAAGMIKFCQRMEWGGLAAILDHYSDRLKAGARLDLLALAEITYIKSRTARIFWENGYKTVGAVAAADLKELLSVLLLAQPKKPLLDSASEEKYIQKLHKKVEIISRSANKLWERQMQEDLDGEE
ncbi:uncharacterized protein BP5553_05953 [Venustampulla echinocandica]|uniref:P-loop containing nucleoside triphosphate hydrolase n=1 Tax=Venustampulla echinocandica TaxID=2656787 RepID=A0A370TM52_9HELO|nr:uncharacterized protein BP5553_05953 [Venustampulla echinocandica]RDL36601.1 hypothetical protein BP5553_05953 [Venustampulla echinocandica]